MRNLLEIMRHLNASRILSLGGKDDWKEESLLERAFKIISTDSNKIVFSGAMYVKEDVYKDIGEGCTGKDTFFFRLFFRYFQTNQVIETTGLDSEEFAQSTLTM